MTMFPTSGLQWLPAAELESLLVAGPHALPYGREIRAGTGMELADAGAGARFTLGVRMPIDGGFSPSSNVLNGGSSAAPTDPFVLNGGGA